MMIRVYFFFVGLVFALGICFAQSSRYLGLYSPEGKVLLKPNTYSYRQITGDTLLVIAQKKDSYGLVSRKGELLIHPQKMSFNDFSALPEYKKWVNENIWLRKNLYDSDNNVIDFDQRIFAECDSSKLSTKGNIIEGVYSNKRKILYNYKDEKVIVKQIFAKWLFADYWAVCPSDSYSRWGVINDRGEEIVPCKYQRIEGYKGRAFRVKYADEYKLLDTTGCMVTDSAAFELNHHPMPIADKRYHKTIDLKEKIFVASYANLIVVRNNRNKYGVVDLSGNTIIPCKWDYIEFYFGNIAVWKNKKPSIWSYFKKKKVYYYI